MSTGIPQATDTHAMETARWRIDPSRSSVEFRSPAFWGLTTAKGRFHSYDGTLDLRHQPAIELTLDADSIDTNNKIRDKHLRSAEFFDVANHPQVRFVSDSAALDGERLKVRGQLYAAGQSMPLDLEARLVPVGDELEVDAQTYADHRQLGMSSGTLGMIRTPSEFIVHGRLVPDSD
jgi:polyisoprenoid-binding protein YceI